VVDLVAELRRPWVDFNDECSDTVTGTGAVRCGSERLAGWLAAKLVLLLY
jgi:hypothetical protein